MRKTWYSSSYGEVLNGERSSAKIRRVDASHSLPSNVSLGKQAPRQTNLKKVCVLCGQLHRNKIDMLTYMYRSAANLFSALVARGGHVIACLVSTGGCLNS